MTVETEERPDTPVRWMVVVGVVLVMDREPAQLLAVKFASVVHTEPRKYLARLLPLGLLQLSLAWVSRST